ncbi:MAG: hypothetical protein CSA20_07965 [Deltaproteobacteria bacterium]|nr:MAG: hypothetical protein CSA20_07965 [Deltaproteobacteria bacterium]
MNKRKQKNSKWSAMMGILLTGSLLCTTTIQAADEGIEPINQNNVHKEKMTKAKKMRNKPMGVVVGSNGGVFPAGKFATILRYYHLDFDQMYQGTDKIDLPPLKAGSNAKQVYERSVDMVNLVLRTGLFEDLDARLLIPMRDKEMKIRTPKGDMTQDNSGIGDMKLISRYRLLWQQQGDPLNLAIGLGIKIPTGSNDSTYNGKTQPAFLQGGTGSWDPVFEIGMHKIFGQHWYSAHIMYQMTTEGEVGENDFEAPDQLNYNIGYMYALSQRLDIGMELNGEVKSKAELNGVEQVNTGGHTLYLTPEINVKFGHGIVFGLSAPIAAYHDLNGTQVGNDYRIAAKLAWFF